MKIMKKTIVAYLGVILLLCAVSATLVGQTSTAQADAGATAVSVSAPSQSVASGEQFTVSIFVSPSTAISGMQFNFEFDPSLVNVDSVEEGDLLGQGGASTYFNPGEIDNQSGTVTGAFGVVTRPGQTVSTEGTFATIRLTAKTQGGSGPLGLSGVVVGDLNGNSVPVSVENGEIAVPMPHREVFNWWALSVIMGVALILIMATTSGILLRRRQMIKGLETGRSG
jgi:hypothetical protein